jgi:Flp pilus assembly protein TadD
MQVLGMLLAKSGRAADAVPHLERAVTVDPNFARYRNNLGNALMEVRSAEDAVTQFRAAIALDCSHWRAWQGLVSALQKPDRPEQALADAHRGVARAARSRRTHRHGSAQCAWTQASAGHHQCDRLSQHDRTHVRRLPDR